MYTQYIDLEKKISSINRNRTCIKSIGADEAKLVSILAERVASGKNHQQ